MTASVATISVRSLKRASPRFAARLKQRAGIVVTPTPAVRGAVMVPAAAVPALSPGKERWPVKTGTDRTATQVNLSAGVVSTTIDELVSAPRPADMPDPRKEYQAFQSRRAPPIETTVWTLDCEITAAKLEQDGDYHLVLRSPSGETMIAEVPDPDPQFVSPQSPFVSDIRMARGAADQHIFKRLLNTPLARRGKYMVPASSFAVTPETTTTINKARKATGSSTPFPVKAAITPTKARITGVGFFDRKHDQLGVAPNGIEIHPVLDIKFL